MLSAAQKPGSVSSRCALRNERPGSLRGPDLLLLSVPPRSRPDGPAPARIGRPPKPADERRGQTIGVRLSTADRATIAEKAARARLTPAEYMRRRALRAPLPVVVPELNRAGWVELESWPGTSINSCGG